jgi:hypothetical protein
VISTIFKSYIEQLQAQLNEKKKQYKDALRMDAPFHIAKKIRSQVIELENALLLAGYRQSNPEYNSR